MKTRKILFPIIIVLAVIMAFDMWLGWENNSIVTTEIDVVSEKIPESFSGYTIVHISDLHNTEFGFRNKRLIKKVKDANPDIIVMTGDMINMYDTKMDVAIEFGEKMAEIAPTYFVTGNHEEKTRGSVKLFEEYEKSGVTILRNEKILIEKNGEKINLLGIDDQNFLGYFLQGTNEENIATVLENLIKDNVGYTVLLAHRPEMIDVYSSFEIDLVFSGHAHGGQMNIPGKGGVLSPGQGWFPKYYKGLYTVRETQMIVNRGLGNSAFPVRINNRPEIVIAELKSK